MYKRNRTLITSEEIYCDFINRREVSLLWIYNVDELTEKLRSGELEVHLTLDGEIKYAVIYDDGELKKVSIMT